MRMPHLSAAAVVALAVVSLAPVACGGEPLTPAPAAPSAAAVAPLDVFRATHEEDSPGILAGGTTFTVVLTRPVDPVPDALALLGVSDVPVKGTTVWLDPQLVVFYPDEKLARGLDLRLVLQVPLRPRAGSALTPRVLDRVSTPAIELSRVRRGSSSQAQPLEPMGELGLTFEPRVPASEVNAHGSITSGGEPVAFVATDGPHDIVVRAKTAFPAAKPLKITWREGPIATTSVGRVRLELNGVSVRAGLRVKVGEEDEHCVPSIHHHWRCYATRVGLVFSSPISDEELALHVHPPLPRRAQGDLRGHRLEVKLASEKPVVVTLDADLSDVFGQKLEAKTTLEIVLSR